MVTFEEKQILATLHSFLPREERESIERVPVDKMIEYGSDFSIRSSEIAARTTIKELLGKALDEEDSRFSLLSSEEAAISIVKELVSKVATSSSEKIASSLAKELLMKATIKSPVDVLDERDVPSLLNVERYFEGLYSFQEDPHVEYMTPDVYISVPASSLMPELPEEKVEEEEEEEEKEEIKYYIPKLFSEGCLPVISLEESKSDIMLSSASRTVTAILKGLISKTVTLDEMAKRTVNRVLNDAMRVVKIALHLEMTKNIKVLVGVINVARQVVEAIEQEVKSAFSSYVSEETIKSEELFAREIVNEIASMVVPEASKEDIVNSVVTEMITKAIDVVFPEAQETSSVLVAKSVISKIIKEVTGESSDILSTSTDGPNGHENANLELSDDKNLNTDSLRKPEENANFDLQSVESKEAIDNLEA